MERYPEQLRRYGSQLRGRSMLVGAPTWCRWNAWCAAIFPVRPGRSTGRAARYAASRCPRDLRESDRLREPIFTPATKATSGHDENIPFAEMKRIVRAVAVSEELRDLSLRVYQAASDYAAPRGILIADTKFEFGRTAAGLALADEVLTPDSSRFWPAEQYPPGRGQESFDKQYVRDYLERIRWNKQPPAPALPADVVETTEREVHGGVSAPQRAGVAGASGLIGWHRQA